jgi:UDP-N-acetylmuramoylalanine--D-glutamate ligase
MNLEIIQQILSPLKGKKIALFSLGKSGFGILKLLSLIDCEIYAWDDDKDVRETVILEYSEKRLSLVKPEFFPFAELDFFIISPGINLKQDKFSTLNKKIAENKLEVINDIQLFLRLFPQVIKIGITGTNGKSTTTALIHHIIKDLDFDAYIGGNYVIAIGEVAY